MTLFDFGCNALTAQSLFQALIGVAACLVVFGGLATLGRGVVAVARFQPTQLFTGWAIVAVLMTAAAVLARPLLQPIAYGLIGCMMMGLLIGLKRGYFAAPFWLTVPVLGGIVLTVINLSGIAKWDDFSHWVPNALYLYQHNAVPAADLPPPHSVWPGYPYALPFLTYLASQLAAGFILQGGAMFNFLMLIGFGGGLAALTALQPVKFDRRNFSLLAVGMIAATLANPGFNASFTVTSQGDTGTMIVTGVLGLLFWRMITAMADGDRTATRSLQIEIALCSALLLLLKQGNIALLGLLTVGFLLMAAKNRQLGRAAENLPALLALAIGMRLLWDHYVARQLGGNGFQLHPLTQWRFDLLGPLAQAMGREALRKSGCFGLIAIMTVAGLVALFRPATPQRNLVLLAGTISGGYVVFLTLCYLGTTFNELEIRRAASFYRYATHVCLLNIAVVWVYAPNLWAALRRRLALQAIQVPSVAVTTTAIAGLLILPLALVVHRDWLVPQTTPELCALRLTGHRLAMTLNDTHRRLGVLDAEGDGFIGYVINFELGLNAAMRGSQSSVIWQGDQFSGNDIVAQAQSQMQTGKIDVLFAPQAKAHPVTIMGFSNQAVPLLLLQGAPGWNAAALR
jgi:hypothetical protein